MTLTIELTPEEEVRLAEEAQRAGVEPADYAHRLIAEDLAVLPENPSGAQVVEYLKQSGALGVYADRGPEFARQLRASVWQGSEEPATEAAGASDPYAPATGALADLGPPPVLTTARAGEVIGQRGGVSVGQGVTTGGRGRKG